MILKLDKEKIRKFSIGICIFITLLLVGFGMYSSVNNSNTKSVENNIETLEQAFTNYKEVATNFESLSVEVLVEGEFTQITMIDSQNQILYTKNNAYEIYTTTDDTYAFQEEKWFRVVEEGNDYEKVKEIALGNNNDVVENLVGDIDYNKVEVAEDEKCGEVNCYVFFYSPEENKSPIKIRVDRPEKKIRNVNYTSDTGEDIDVTLDYNKTVKIPQEALDTTEVLEN